MLPTRKQITALVRDALKNELSLTELKTVELKMKSGELEGVFWEAVESAIESKRAEHYQETGKQ